MRDIEALMAALEALRGSQRLRRRRVLSGSQGVHVQLDGRPLVSFASNDYLGLAGQIPDRGALAMLGSGAGASHLLGGHHDAHQLLEDTLARHVGMPAALLYSTGYMANIGVVGSLMGRGDALFADRLNHASLMDACQLSRAEHIRYRHGDLDHLEELLRESKAPGKMIVSDAVFSMDGDIADAPGLLELAVRYGAWLYLDDAHGYGVLGEDGRGTLDDQGLTAGLSGHPMLIYMATLGKAVGVHGAFVAAHGAVIDWLVNRSRTYIYTTAMPPDAAAIIVSNIERMRTQSWRRERLHANVARFRQSMQARNHPLLPSRTAIQPYMVGGEDDALSLMRDLESVGLYVPAIRPPTVPAGGSRLRISISALHEAADIDCLVSALEDCAHAR